MVGTANPLPDEMIKLTSSIIVLIPSGCQINIPKMYVPSPAVIPMHTRYHILKPDSVTESQLEIRSDKVGLGGFVPPCFYLTLYFRR